MKFGNGVRCWEKLEQAQFKTEDNLRRSATKRCNAITSNDNTDGTVSIYIQGGATCQETFGIYSKLPDSIMPSQISEHFNGRMRQISIPDSYEPASQFSVFTSWAIPAVNVRVDSLLRWSSVPSKMCSKSNVCFTCLSNFLQFPTDR